jgi:hypothetical protein
MGYRALAEVTMVVHFAYLAFVVGGGLLAWRWPRAFWLHLVATLWGFATVTIGLICPLTTVEHWARQRAGQPGLPPSGFIDHYLAGVVYPQRYADVVTWLVAAAVIVSWAGLLIRWRRGALQRSSSAPARR